MKKIAINADTKIITFEKAPKDFDLESAKPHDLLRYGLPAIPKDSKARKRYRQVIGNVLKNFDYIEPEFEIVRPKSDLRLKKKAAITEGTDNLGNWSGGEVQAVQGFSWVSGEFTVPNVSAISTPFKFLSSHWIGLGQGNVLQTGVECDAILDGKKQKTSFYTWWEFFPFSPLVKITNFPAVPGDMLQLLICSDSGNGSQGGTIYLTNVIRGLATSFHVEVAGASLDATWAEWISEIPAENGPPVISVLADFGQVYYSYCVAGLQDGGVMTVGDGNVINMVVDVNNPTDVVCEGILLGDDVVRVRYLGPVPS